MSNTTRHPLTTTEIHQRMEDLTGSTAEPCTRCGRMVWADDEIGAYVDSRMITEGHGSTYVFCEGTTGHEA